jgi:hypothetical protein
MVCEALDRIEESPVHPWLDRAVALGVVLSAVAVIALLVMIQPDARGHGTHEQLGMPACGWVLQYGRPCPTCGVTTAASHLVHLRPFDALRVQPFGTGFALAGLWIAGVAALCLLRGRSFADYMLRLPVARILVIGLLLLLVSWAYVDHSFRS